VTDYPHDPQLLKGVLSLLLLELLAQRESYGYEVVQRLHTIGLIGVLEGTVYPALSRLEREGRLTTRLVPSNSGPARKYYRPTTAGYETLAAGTASWMTLAEIVNAQLSQPIPTEPTSAQLAPPTLRRVRRPAAALVDRGAAMGCDVVARRDRSAR
jgi:PadR family transcriptional regulator, regulatory protein PadR